MKLSIIVKSASSFGVVPMSTWTRKRSRASHAGTSGHSDDDLKSPKRKQQLSKQSTIETRNSKKIRVKHDEISDNLEIELSNEYETLSDNDSEVEIVQNKAKNKGKNQSKEPPKIHIPPIVVPPPTTKNVVTQLFVTNNLVNYRLRMSSTGIYVFVDTVEDHLKVREVFSTSNIGYFSHDLPADKVSKVMLKGLDRMEPSVLKAELSSLGFPAADVKVIVPKNSRYSDHTNYLLYFPKSSTDIKALYAVKAIFHTIVYWEPYRPVRTSPTQCRRCFMYGHGTRHCKMPVKCQYCSASHAENRCPAVKEAYEKVKEKDPATPTADLMDTEETEKTTEHQQTKLLHHLVPTCCLCGGRHLATDPNCEARKKYESIKKKHPSS